MVGAAENYHQSLIVHWKLRLGGTIAIRIAEFARMSDLNRVLGFPGRSSQSTTMDRGREPLVPHGYSNVISDDSE
jgi:hypothetical protein